MGASNRPNKVLVQTDASRVYEGEIVADEAVGGGDVVVALSSSESISGVETIGQPGQYGIAKRGQEVRVTVAGASGVVEAAVVPPPADAIPGESGLTTGSVHARVVPDTADRFEVSNADGSVDFLRVDEDGTRPNVLATVSADVDADFTFDALAGVYRGVGGALGITGTLPLAAAAPDRLYCLGKADAGVGAVVMAAAGADTIDGSASVSLSNQYEGLAVKSNGVALWCIQYRYPFTAAHASTHAPDGSDTLCIAPTVPGAYPYAVLAADETILADEGGLAATNIVELPAATGSGREITVICVLDAAGVLEVGPDGTDQINLAGAGTHYAGLVAAGNAATFKDAAAGSWWIKHTA